MNKSATIHLYMKDLFKYHNKIKRPLILDGAVGSLLQQRNIPIHKSLWSSYANIMAPDEVIKIHTEYINSGADIITTNTFRTNPIAYKQAELDISNKEFINTAVELAFKSIQKSSRTIFVAGSNPPAEDSYQLHRNIPEQELEYNHKYHVDMLWESGVDFILNETQSHYDEIKIICKHCNNSKIPFIISLFVTAEGKLLSGENISDVIKEIIDYSPLAIAINCILPETFIKIFNKITISYNWGFYLNCGSGDFSDKEIFEGVTPSDYIAITGNYFNKNPLFVGTCCGSSPLHTKAIKEYFDKD